MLATRSLTAPDFVLSSDGELLHHVVCRVAQTVFEIVGLMSFSLAGAHQLRMTNSIEAGERVNR